MQSCLIYLTGVVALGLAAQWLAWRLRLPAILLLLAFGFLFGLMGGEATDPELLIGSPLLFPVVSLAVAVILFEGGLSLRIAELRQTGRAVLGLVTVGIAVTWLLTAVAAVFCLGFEPAMATLLGAILVVSGPTVIIPLLRQVRPNRRIGSIVKWEGIVNDPIGAVLAVVILYSIRAESPSFLPVPGVLLAPVVFVAVGVAFGLHYSRPPRPRAGGEFAWFPSSSLGTEPATEIDGPTSVPKQENKPTGCVRWDHVSDNPRSHRLQPVGLDQVSIRT